MTRLQRRRGCGCGAGLAPRSLRTSPSQARDARGDDGDGLQRARVPPRHLPRQKVTRRPNPLPRPTTHTLPPPSRDRSATASDLCARAAARTAGRVADVSRTWPGLEGSRPTRAATACACLRQVADAGRVLQQAPEEGDGADGLRPRPVPALRSPFHPAASCAGLHLLHP